MRGGRGNFRGGNPGGGRGGFRGRRGHQDFMATPSVIQLLGKFLHMCEDFAVCEAENTSAPLINRPVFTKDKKRLGVIDEIYGPIESYGFTIKLDEGVSADTFEEGTKVYVDPMSLKPLTFFQSKSKPPKQGRELNKQGKIPKIAKGPNAIFKRGAFRGQPAARGFRGSNFRGNFASRGTPRGIRRG